MPWTSHQSWMTLKRTLSTSFTLCTFISSAITVVLVSFFCKSHFPYLFLYASVVRHKFLYMGVHTILQFEFIRRKLEGSSGLDTMKNDLLPFLTKCERKVYQRPRPSLKLSLYSLAVINPTGQDPPSIWLMNISPRT